MLSSLSRSIYPSLPFDSARRLPRRVGVRTGMRAECMAILATWSNDRVGDRHARENLGLVDLRRGGKIESSLAREFPPTSAGRSPSPAPSSPRTLTCVMVGTTASTATRSGSDVRSRGMRRLMK
jgi:hypothetical protein